MVSKSQKKAGVKPNHGNTGNSPMDHWAFGAFDWHIQNKLCAIKAKSLTYFVFPFLKWIH